MGLEEKDENRGREDQNTWDRRKKNKKNESKELAVVGSDKENEWIVKIKIIILYN